MRYIPSQEIKEKDIKAEKLGEVSWMVGTGLLPDIFKKYEAVSTGRALDLGCGVGSTAIFLKKYFQKISGIDLASHLSKEALAIVELSKVDLNFEPLPYESGSFDVVTAFQVIEHLENPFFIMREVHRVLRKDGLFIMSVPNPFQITFRIKFLFTGNMPPYTAANNHLLFLTRGVFKKTYLANFELLETIYQKGDVPFWGRLRHIFGKKIAKHKKVLPRSEFLGRCTCYILKKR